MISCSLALKMRTWIRNRHDVSCWPVAEIHHLPPSRLVSSLDKPTARSKHSRSDFHFGACRLGMHLLQSHAVVHLVCSLIDHHLHLFSSFCYHVWELLQGSPKLKQRNNPTRSLSVLDCNLYSSCLVHGPIVWLACEASLCGVVFESCLCDRYQVSF